MINTAARIAFALLAAGGGPSSIGAQNIAPDIDSRQRQQRLDGAGEPLRLSLVPMGAKMLHAPNGDVSPRGNEPRPALPAGQHAAPSA